MDWQDLLTALALMLVIEGIYPFLSPQGFRRALAMLVVVDDKGLRVAGLICMLGGLVLLSLK